MDKIIDTGPSAAMVMLLATACGIVVANIYYAHPLIGLIGPEVGLGPHAASLIVSLTQLGYAAGLLLLVPLGDLVENRRLVVLTVACSIPPLLLAAHLTPEHRRGRVVGNVMSGLLFGILLARPIASIIADVSSWRVVF